MDILDLLANDNYIPFNRTLAKELGIEPAILFGALCGYQRHYKMQEFFREQANIMEDTCLTEYAVRQATKILQDKELIVVNKKGLPAKNYYQINTTKLLEYLSTSGCENDTTGHCENETTSDYKNEDDNKIKYKTKNKIDNKLLIKENIKEKEIFDYWNLKDIIRHKELKPNMLKSIQKALKEYSVEQIKEYIDRYNTVIKDTTYFFGYKWTLTDFLNRKDGISSFTDEGSKWLSYQGRSEKGYQKPAEEKPKFMQHEYSKEELNGLFDKLD